MQTKRITCPKCHILLEVRNSKGEAEKIITCPKCHSTLRVTFQAASPGVPTDEPLDAPTFTPDTGNTILAGHKPQPQATVKKPCLRIGLASYELRVGANTVGRKAPSSTASIQIATDDHYMSRRHAIINVTRLASGALKAVISGDSNKNPITVDGMELQPGDALRLQSGNRILMGKTTVIYAEE